MRFEKTGESKLVEILANDHWAAVPITVGFAPGVDVVKAGTPLAADGTLAAGANVKGILLYDVTPNNPNGSIVYHGAIETKRAQNWSGVTITPAMRQALPQIFFN